MGKNINSIEAYIRLLLGIAIILNIFIFEAGSAGIVLLIMVGSMNIYTACTGFSLLYDILNINTNPKASGKIAIAGNEEKHELLKENTETIRSLEQEFNSIGTQNKPPETVITKEKEIICSVIDRRYRSMTFRQLCNAPVYSLQGVKEEQAFLLEKIFKIRSIRDLAGFKYARWAQSIVELSENEELPGNNIPF